MYNIKESDWKLYKKLVPIWQERYMEKLNNEYLEILSKEKEASTIFWELEKRINKDKKSLGVIINMRRSTMHQNVYIMLRDNIINFEDIREFSDDFKEIIKLFY